MKDLNYDNSLEQANLIKPIITLTDLMIKDIDIEYLQKAKKEMTDRLRRSESISFMIGGNQVAEEKRELEIKTLRTLIDFLIARKEQQLKAVELFEKGEEFEKFRTSIKDILG